MSVTLEIVEGPGAGQRVDVDRPLVVGRAADVDVVVTDAQVSRHHCRLSPAEGGALVEDLNSRNGTFLNDQQVFHPALVAPGDELLVGVTVFELHDAAEQHPTAPRPLPPALAVPARPPDYVPPPAKEAGVFPVVLDDAEGPLDPYLDVHTKARTRLAPVFVLGLAALFLILYLLT